MSADDELPVFGTIASQFNDAGHEPALYRRARDDRAGRPARRSRPTRRAPAADGRDGARSSRADRGALPRRDRRDQRGATTRFVRHAGGDRAAHVPAARRHASSCARAGQAALAVHEPADGRRGARRAHRRRGPGWLAELEAEHAALEARLDPDCRRTPRRVAGDRGALPRRPLRVQGARQGDRARTCSPSRSPHCASRRSRCPATTTGATSSAGSSARTPPGMFPFTAGVFPLKREGEDPARMFAGEGGPERTNKRFHYVSRGLPGQAPVDGVRLGDALRRGPDAPAGHLRQGRQLGRVRRHASTTPRSSTPASTSATRRPRSR